MSHSNSFTFCLVGSDTTHNPSYHLDTVNFYFQNKGNKGGKAFPWGLNYAHFESTCLGASVYLYQCYVTNSNKLTCLHSLMNFICVCVYHQWSLLKYRAKTHLSGNEGYTKQTDDFLLLFYEHYFNRKNMLKQFCLII